MHPASERTLNPWLIALRDIPVSWCSSVIVPCHPNPGSCQSVSRVTLSRRNVSIAVKCNSRRSWKIAYASTVTPLRRGSPPAPRAALIGLPHDSRPADIQRSNPRG